MKESPIFIKSFEMLQWLLNHTRKFPKHQRFVMARRMEEAALDFHDEILRATRSLLVAWHSHCGNCIPNFGTPRVSFGSIRRCI